MLKHANARKVNSAQSRRQLPKSAGRSLLKPILVLGVLVAAALTVAVLLVKRSGSDNPVVAGNTQSSLNSAPVITTGGWAKGNLAAKTVLVEFGDFQCPSCALARLKVDNVLKKFEKDLKVVFKQYPMENIHRNAMLAAQVSEAAGQQMKFWEMHELLFARQNEWSNVPDAQTFFLRYAAELHMDVEKLRQDLFQGEIRNKIFRDMLEGQVAQVRSVPTFFLNGKLMPAVKSDAEFEEAIAQAIRTAH